MKLVDRKSTKDLIQILGLEEANGQLGKANGVRWYGLVLRKDKHLLRKILDYDNKGYIKQALTNENLDETGEEVCRKVGWIVSDVNNYFR